MNVFWMFANAILCAGQAAWFAANGSPYHLALAILSGFVALALLAQDAFS